MNYEEKLAHKLDAENAVIGSLLIDSSIAKDVFAKVDGADFLNGANRQIFQTARALFRAGEPVDAVAIRNRLGTDYNDYFLQLMEITPTSANWEQYAAYMKEQTALQRVKDLAQDLLEAVSLDGCRTAVASLGQLLSSGQKVDAWNMRELLDDFFASQEAAQEAVQYITYGIPHLDEGTYTEPGDVVMIGGYPSDGKTALALMMAYHMAASHKVGFFSLETDKRKIRDRMVSHVAQIDFNDIKRRTMKDGDWTAVAAKSADFVKRDLTVLRGSGMTATDIQSISQAYGFEVVFIDYVQLIVPETARGTPRSEQMADVSRSLHIFAQRTGITVVELAQLTRPERGGWREPDMHDLKESGQFEQDADLILMLFRPGPHSQWEEDKHRFLKIAKQKEGRWGTWPMFFDGSKQTFSVVVDDNKAVLRSLVDAGKKARYKNRVEALGQQTIPEIVELPPGDTKDLPF